MFSYFFLMSRSNARATLFPYTTLFRSPCFKDGSLGWTILTSCNKIAQGLPGGGHGWQRSEEHTSELQSLRHLVCRLLLEKKKNLAKDHLEARTRKISSEVPVPLPRPHA